MSCYMRHMLWLLDALGLEDDTRTRKRVDMAIRSVLGMGADAQCPEVWAQLKQLDEDARMALVPEVAERLG